FRQMESWLDGNPFLRGINWASALEVAMRALSWAWLWHMAGDEMPVALRARGVLYPEFPRAARWVETGGRIVEQQMERQVRGDGSHFEQSAYYHLYALDFFLLYRVLAKPPGTYDARLVAMAGYLDALLGVS